MRLAILLYKYFPYGGMQRDFARFIEELQERGHECRVYFIRWQGEMLSQVESVEVPVRAATNHRRNERYYDWVSDHLSHNPVDGVIGFNKMPGLDVYYAADSCYLDKAMSERGWWYRRGARFRHFAAYEAAVFAPSSTTEILLISDTERRKFVHYYDTPESRLHMLPPGIAPDRRAGPDAPQRRRSARRAAQLDDELHVLLFVGSGFIKKGLARAILALAHLRRSQPERPACLLVVGQDKESRFRRLAARLGVGDAVRFLGGRDDIPDLLLAADVLIHPALDEAAGIVLLEALVAGLPVLVTDVCGYAHHIEAAEAGVVLASPFDQRQLDEALEMSLSEDFRSACTDNALRYAQEEDLYSMHRTGAELIETLVLQRRANAGADSG